MMVDTRSVAWPALVTEEPIQAGPLAVYPLLSASAPPNEPGYLLLEQAIKEGLVQVTEVTDAGCVPTIALINNGTLPVLAVQGQELVGAKQNRTLNVSLLAPRGRTEIPVTCVERGRWGYRGARFDSGSFEHHRLRRMKTEQVHDSIKQAIEKKRRYLVDQMAVWAEVDRESDRHLVASATSALNDVYAAGHVKSQLGNFDILDDLPPDTVGVVVAMSDELVAAELMENPEAFRSLWPKLRQGYALSALHKPERPCPDRNQAAAFVALPQSASVAVTDSVALGDDARWEGREFLATALVHEDRVLHGTMFTRLDDRQRR